MRHVRSILYALVLAPVIWVLVAVGFTDDLSSRGREFFAVESVSGLLLVIFAGILFAILAGGPVSPAGPVLTGIVFLGVTIWAWNSPAAYASLWAPEVAKDSFDLSRPGYGLAALLAIPLLGTALSARRWARYEPPVLPIIGEIGRFRGAAKVAGTPMAAERTTVIRTGRPGMPATADADRTVAFNAGAGSDRTTVLPTADPTVVVAANDRTVSVAQPPAPKPAAAPPAVPKPAAAPTVPPKPAAAPTVPPKPTATASPASESEPTTVLPVVPDKPAGAGKPAATTDSPAPAPAVSPTPVVSPASTSSTASPAPAVEKDEDTFVLGKPDADRAQASADDADATRPLQLPATAGAGTDKSGTDEATAPGGLVTPPDEKTELLRLPTEPTVVIPAQRRPPAVES